MFDRNEGKLLLAQQFTRKMTWATGIGADGRPQAASDKEVSCPDHATNWNGTAYSPATRLYYVMVLEKCSSKLSPGTWKKELPNDPGTKYLRALDIETGKIVWEVAQTGPVDGKRVAGILGTAGDSFSMAILMAISSQQMSEMGNALACSAERNNQNLRYDLYRRRRTVFNACSWLEYHELRTVSLD